MNEHLSFLALAYVALLALLALALVYSRLPVIAKFALVILTALLYHSSYQGWKQAQGWPSPTPLPEKFLLHASVIEEPDTEQGTPGQIFIWASNLKGSLPSGEPRAYITPYGEEAHSALEDALRNQRNGNIQIGSSKRSSNEPGDVPKDMSRMGEENAKLDFSNLPDPTLPEK